MTQHLGVVEINRPSQPAGPAERKYQVSRETCGYSYTEWVNSGLYPAGRKPTDMQKKFDYDYSAAELQEGAAPHLKILAFRSGQGIIFFNNHVRAQAPGKARELIKIPGE